MTTFLTWQGTDGDFNAAGNWIGATVPSLATHVAVFDGSVSNIPPTTNLNRGAAEVFSLRVRDNYSGGIGSSGNPLSWEAGDCWINGSGTYHLDAVNAADPELHIGFGHGYSPPTVYFTCQSGASAYNACIGRGHLIVSPTGDLNGADVILTGTGSRLTVEAASATQKLCSRLIQHGGESTIARVAPTSAGRFFLHGGECTMTGLLDAASNVHICGGVMTYTPATQTAKNATIYGMAGVLDLSGNSIAVLTGKLYGGPLMNFIPSIAEPNGVALTYDLSEAYPGANP